MSSNTPAHDQDYGTYSINTGDTIGREHPMYGKLFVYVDRPVYCDDPEKDRAIATLRREVAGLKQEVFRLRQKQFSKHQ